jgi:starvation-inducible DNA-binding protein
MQTQLEIKVEQQEGSARILKIFLGDEFVLYGKTKIAHWNVEDSGLHEKHKFFEEQYEHLDEIMDSVADRIRALGHYTPFTVERLLEYSFLTEQEWWKNDAADFIKDLLFDHESIIIRLGQNINIFSDNLNDIETSDFIAGLKETHEKMAGMLRAHLK